jgi:hypothetical protein
LLDAPAPLRRKNGVIGTNVTWTINKSVETARNDITGQGMDWDSRLFHDPVVITCPSVDVQVGYGSKKSFVEVREWCMPVRVSMSQVFESIHWIHKSLLGRNQERVYKGLKEIREGQYLLQLGS